MKKLSSNNIVKQTGKKLTKRERKYCSCLMKVRPRVNNPYGICTSSVYNKQNVKRKKVVNCSSYYDYNILNMEMLKAYASEKKIPTRSKGRYISKKKLIKRIDQYKKNKIKSKYK